MCDQIPVKVCEQLTLVELICLEGLKCRRDNVDAHSTVAQFLKDTMEGKTPSAKPNDRFKAVMELMRLNGLSSPGSNPNKPKFTSKDLLRLGYGCAHDAE